jgi:hypothetical protein
MTPFKNYTQNPSWTNRVRKGSLYVAVAAMLGMQMSCGSSDNGNDWEQVTVREATKGVVTTLEESSGGEFTIVNERVVQSKDSSRVIIKHLDGKVDTLTLTQAKGLVQPQDTVIRNTVVTQHRGGGLGHVLWWSSMGYMIGRNFGTPPPQYIYRDDDRNRNNGFYRGGSAGGGYFSGSRAADEINRTAVTRTEMRPVSGRSGFFRGFGRSSGRG